MGIFFTSQKGPAGLMSGRFDCVTSMKELHHLEELEEGNQHLEQFSAYLRDINIIQGCDVKHLLGISEIPLQPLIINGSKERNNMFYHHKFRLALLDLISSHYAFTKPNPEEKKCYEQILVVPPSQAMTKEVSVYSDDLWFQFFIKVLGNINNLGKHCGHVGNNILAKLSMPISWQKLASLCTEDSFNEDEDEGVRGFIKESLKKCNLSSTQLEVHVKDVGRFLKIAHYIRGFLHCLRELKLHVHRFMNDVAVRPNIPSDPYAVNLDWQAVHACTLLKDGYLSERKEEDDNGSVAMLKAILVEIRMIGDWHLEPLPTCKEDHILLNISRRITSCTHFFLSAMAYEQRTRVIQHGGVIQHGDVIQLGRQNVVAVGMMARKRKRQDMDPFISSLTIVRRWEAFISILEGYKEGLLDKLYNS